jgi:hypothetical protein
MGKWKEKKYGRTPWFKVGAPLTSEMRTMRPVLWNRNTLEY